MDTDALLKNVFPDIASRYRRVAQDFFEIYGLKLKVTSGLRTSSEQWELYGKGRQREKSGAWVVTNAKAIVTYALPLQSFHNYGLALDVAFIGLDPYLEKVMPRERASFLWDELGRLAKAHGFEWGGDFTQPDRPHIQLRYGMGLKEIQQLYEFGGLRGVFFKCQKVTDGK